MVKLKIDGAGLAPHLEEFSREILRAVQRQDDARMAGEHVVERRASARGPDRARVDAVWKACRDSLAREKAVDQRLEAAAVLAEDRKRELAREDDHRALWREAEQRAYEKRMAAAAKPVIAPLTIAGADWDAQQYELARQFEIKHRLAVRPELPYPYHRATDADRPGIDAAPPPVIGVLPAPVLTAKPALSGFDAVASGDHRLGRFR